MTPHSELKDWIFEMEEISAGVYRAAGHDEFGRTVEAQGTEPEKLLEECRAAARAITSNLSAPDRQARG